MRRLRIEVPLDQHARIFQRLELFDAFGGRSFRIGFAHQDEQRFCITVYGVQGRATIRWKAEPLLLLIQVGSRQPAKNFLPVRSPSVFQVLSLDSYTADILIVGDDTCGGGS
jgi:hypothetical protein